MKSRKLIAATCAGLMLASPFAAYAATTVKPASTANHSCANLTGKALHDCNAKLAHAAKPAKPAKP